MTALSEIYSPDVIVAVLAGALVYAAAAALWDRFTALPRPGARVVVDGRRGVVTGTVLRSADGDSVQVVFDDAKESEWVAADAVKHDGRRENR